MHSIPRAVTCWSALGALLLLGTSCSVTPPAEINARYGELIEQRREQYEIKPGDQVTISVYGTETTREALRTQQLTILPDGRADGFFLESFRFGGRTVLEVKNRLHETYTQEVGEANVIDVAVNVEPAEEQVVVNGHVQRPGVVDLEQGMTLRDALAEAGHWRLTADSNYVFLRRPFGHPPGRPAYYRVDPHDVSEEILLLPNDEIRVDPNFLASVVEHIKTYIFGIIPTAIYGGAVGAAF